MFSYHPEVPARFPTIRAGVALATGLSNGPSPPALLEQFRVQQRKTLAELGDAPLSEVPSLAAWRRVFAGFGVKPTQYRNAAEALLRRLTKQGDIPSLNLLADLGNLVAVRHRLPVAVLDAGAVAGSLTVRFADGSESFTGLGAGESSPEPGEVVFIDEAGTVSARRWCWRQSAVTAAGPGTETALFAVEAHHETAAPDTARAVADIKALLEEHQPTARCQTALLSPQSPIFTITKNENQSQPR